PGNRRAGSADRQRDGRASRRRHELTRDLRARLRGTRPGEADPARAAAASPTAARREPPAPQGAAGERQRLNRVSETPALLASDADRERTIATLRDHAAEGRLTLEEFTDRMSSAYLA